MKHLQETCIRKVDNILFVPIGIGANVLIQLLSLWRPAVEIVRVACVANVVHIAPRRRVYGIAADDHLSGHISIGDVVRIVLDEAGCSVIVVRAVHRNLRDAELGLGLARLRASLMVGHLGVELDMRSGSRGRSRCRGRRRRWL